MNKFEIVGNLTRDVELKYSQGGKAIARFTVATQRKYKNAQGNYDSDFLPCTAFDKTAEFLEKYFKKGSGIEATGHLQSGSYENKEGKKVYTLDLFVEEVGFVGSKKDSDNRQDNNISQEKDNNGFTNVTDGIDEELPFN